MILCSASQYSRCATLLVEAARSSSINNLLKLPTIHVDVVKGARALVSASRSNFDLEGSIPVGRVVEVVVVLVAVAITVALAGAGLGGPTASSTTNEGAEDAGGGVKDAAEDVARATAGTEADLGSLYVTADNGDSLLSSGQCA